MATHELVQRVCIYLSEHDRWEGQPLYLAVLELLQREGATGATVLRGVAGFGPGRRTRTSGRADLREHPPLVVEWVDRSERIARLLPLLDEMLPGALITLEDLHVYRAVLRARGRFADERAVGDLMLREVASAGPGLRLGEAIALLLESGQEMLPLLDGQGLLIGLVAEQELMRHGVPLPIRLLRLLEPSERRELLAPLADRPLSEVMSRELRTLSTGSSITRALSTMIEWNYTQVPVVEQDGRLAGLLGQQEVLAASLDSAPDPTNPIRDAEPPTPVRLIMQTSVPHAGINQPLQQLLEQLLAARHGYLLLVAAGGRFEGMLTDSGLLQRLPAAERAAFLTALARPGATVLPDSNQPAGDFIERDGPTIAPTASITEATRLMLKQSLDRLPVVDEGRLEGIIARGALLRALGQEAE